MKLKHSSLTLVSLTLLSIFFFAQSALPQKAQAQTLIAQNMQNGIITTDGIASIGTVISLQAGVFALRDGQEIPLELKSLIQEKDTIITNSTGKVQIILHDDTTLALAPNSRLLMEEFSMDEENPIIRTNLSQGLVRSITGIIVEQNPDGFAMKTPRASITIRGTIFAVGHENDITNTYVFNTQKQVLVNGLDIPAGYQYSTYSDEITPITQDTFREINAQVYIPATTQTGASQGDTAETEETEEVEEIVDTDNTEDSADDFDDDNGLDGGNASPPPEVELIAVISGSMNETTPGSTGSGTGTFSFNANLSTGNVSDAEMHINTPDLSGNSVIRYNFDDGTGTVEGDAVDIDFVNGEWSDTDITSGTDIITGSGNDATGSLIGNITNNPSPGQDVGFIGEGTAEGAFDSDGNPHEEWVGDIVDGAGGVLVPN